MTQTASRLTARERLLDAATELFYAEGIHTVGIDRIIAHAGVAKASLYKTFGSKDELVRSYLQQRHAATEARITAALERWDDPREKFLGVFVAQGERMAEPSYHGCPFISASAESEPDSAALQATVAYRTWLRSLFTELAVQAGITDTEDAAGLARQCVMLYDGAALTMRIDGNRGGATAAGAAARVLLDAALAH